MHGEDVHDYGGRSAVRSTQGLTPEHVTCESETVHGGKSGVTIEGKHLGPFVQPLRATRPSDYPN